MNKLLIGAVFSSIFSVSAALHAGLKVTPIQLCVAEKNNQRSATVTFDYSGSDAIKIFEATAVKWTQNEKGEDVYIPDPDVLINPRNFVLQPESKQVVRVGFPQPVRAMNLKEEGTWRVIFNETPPVADQNSMNFLFNISMPLFAGEQKSANLAPSISYRGNHLIVTLHNKAMSHIQIKDLAIEDASGKAIASSNNMTYLLANKQNEFDMGQVKLENQKKYTLKINTDKGDKPLEIIL